MGYSYSWWTNTWSAGGKKVATFHAGGWGGQDIIVIPELNSVVVFTGGTYTSVTKQWKVFRNYVLPAIL